MADGSGKMLPGGEREMKILADRLLELDHLIENELSEPQSDVDNVAVGAETDTHQFVRDMMNVNTVRKTNGDIKKFENFLKESREFREIQIIPPSELDGLLAKFFLSLKKKDGSEFEPQTLKSIQGSINRHLAQNGSNINIVEDREFKHSRDVLTSKRKLLRQQGKGNKENRAEPFTTDEINMLYEGNQLGTGNPRAVVQTVYLNNCLHFGMRSRIEHENLRWGDVALKCLSNGDEYLEYRERTTKTRTGLSDECRDFIPKMFADKGNLRCPVAAYKVYSSKRPEVMNTAESPFYLGVKRRVNSYDETWYVNQAMGKNTIGSIVKDMCTAVGIQGRKSNHSARKTGITSLVHAGVAPTLVQQLSGHKNITSINNYSSASIQQQKDMSSILTKYTSSCSTAAITPHELAPRNSQEVVEQVLNDISSYETTEIQNSSNNTSTAAVAEPDTRNSDLLGLANNVASSFLSGATMHVAGNIIFQFGMPDSITPSPKRKRINESDSD